MKLRVRIGLALVAAALTMPVAARAEVLLTPMTGSPVTGVGQGGIIEAVDLNGDDLDDLAIGSTGGVRVRLADSDGTWSNGATLLPGNSIADIISGDLDKDGKEDLVIASWNQADPFGTSEQFTTFRGHGDGTFSAAQPITTAAGKVIVAHPTGQTIRLIDLNEDGKLDLVAALTRYQIGVAAGNGDGNFTQFDAATLNDQAEDPVAGFSTLAMGDFNGDGSADLALGMAGETPDAEDPESSGVFVMYRESGQSFSAPQWLPMSEPFGDITRLIATDLNHDQSDELIATRIGGESGNLSTDIVVWAGNPDGFAVAVPSRLVVLPDPDSLTAAADFSGDGTMDLAWSDSDIGTGAAGPTSLAISLWHPVNGFAGQPGSFPLSFAANQGAPSYMETGDFNGDRAPDVATSFSSADCGVSPCGTSVLVNQPVVEVNRTSIDFGNGERNANPASETFTISNDGGAPARMTTVTLSQSEPARFHLTGTCPSIAPAGTCSPTVSFDRSATGSSSATLTIGFEGTARPVQISLSGQVEDHRASISPGQIDFGDVGLEDPPVSRKLTLTAEGASGLAVGNLQLTGPGAGSFLLDANTCDGAALSTGEQCSVEVTTALKAAGTATASIRVPGNASDMPVLVPVFANGIAPVYKAALKLTGPGKVRAGRRFKVTANITNTGTASLEGAILRFRAAQGKAVKARGTYRLSPIAVGKKLARPVTISIPKKKLKRGKPVVVTLTLVHTGQTLASKGYKVKQEFG